MKKFNVRFLVNIATTIALISVIVLYGVKEPIAYNDGPGITLTQNGKVKIVSIEGVDVEGQSITVQNDTAYEFVSLEYYGELIDYESFTFNSDETDMSFSIDYYEDGFYIDRDFSIFKGFKSLGLFAVVVLLIQLIYYVGFIVGFSDVEDENRMRMSLGRRLMNVPFLANSMLITVTLLVFLADLIFNFIPYLYNISDSVLLVSIGSMIAVLYIFAFYSTLTKQDYEFIFESDRLIVNHRKKDFFSSLYTDLKVDGSIARSSNGITGLNLKLANQSNSVDMNLLFMGEHDFNELTSRLYRLARVNTDEEVSDIELYVKEKNRMPMMLILLGVLITATLAVVGIILEDPMVLAFASAVPLIVLVIYFVKFRKTVKRASIVVNEHGIQIGNHSYDRVDRIKIEHLSTGVNRMLPFSINKDSYFIYINYQKIDYSKSYKQFYVEINQYYGDKIKN